MKTQWEGMINKGSLFADFVRFCLHTYTRTQQYLPPLWAAIILEDGLRRSGILSHFQLVELSLVGLIFSISQLLTCIFASVTMPVIHFDSHPERYI